MRIFRNSAAVSIFAITMFAGQSHAQEPKRDIRGVTTGMTIAEAVEILRKQGATCSKEKQFCQWDAAASMWFYTNVPGSDKITTLIYNFHTDPDNGNQMFSHLERTYHLRTVTGDQWCKTCTNLKYYYLPTGESFKFNASGIVIEDKELEKNEAQRIKSAKVFIPPKL